MNPFLVILLIALPVLSSGQSLVKKGNKDLWWNSSKNIFDYSTGDTIALQYSNYISNRSARFKKNNDLRIKYDFAWCGTFSLRERLFNPEKIYYIKGRWYINEKEGPKQLVLYRLSRSQRKLVDRRLYANIIRESDNEVILVVTSASDAKIFLQHLEKN